MSSHEQRSRSVVKAVSYRALSMSVDMLVAYFFTRQFVTSLSIVAIVNAYSTFLYYGHERIWSKIRWGRKH